MTAAQQCRCAPCRSGFAYYDCPYADQGEGYSASGVPLLPMSLDMGIEV